MNDTDEPDQAIRAALATLVATEPDLPVGTADIEQRGRQRLARRNWGVALAVTVVAAAGITALSLPGRSVPTTPVASPPDATASLPEGSTLVQGFPIGSAVDAVGSALPAGTRLGEVPMDIAWQPGGLLDVPVVIGAATFTLTVQVHQGTCDAWMGADAPAGAGLTADELRAVAASVCAEWAAGGSLPVIPADPTAGDDSDLAAS